MGEPASCLGLWFQGLRAGQPLVGKRTLPVTLLPGSGAPGLGKDAADRLLVFSLASVSESNGARAVGVCVCVFRSRSSGFK